MKRILMVLTVFILFACGSVKLLTPTQDDLAKISSKYPDVSLLQLDEGKKIMEKNCDKCHKMPDPKSQTQSGWLQIVPKMTLKVNNKAGDILINSEQREALLRYLVSQSKFSARDL